MKPKNRLVLIRTEQENMPIGSFKDGQQTIMTGEELTRTPTKVY